MLGHKGTAPRQIHSRAIHMIPLIGEIFPEGGIGKKIPESTFDINPTVYSGSPGAVTDFVAFRPFAEKSFSAGPGHLFSAHIPG
jgi:hypothetical protein